MWFHQFNNEYIKTFCLLAHLEYGSIKMISMKNKCTTANILLFFHLIKLFVYWNKQNESIFL